MSAQSWVLDDALARLPALMPLVFHPLTMVRRAIATFLTPVIFLPPCQLADPSMPSGSCDGDAASPAASAHSIEIFAPFTASHYLPMPSVALPLPVRAAESAACDSAAASLLGSDGRDKLHMVGLLLSLGQIVDLTDRSASDGSAEARMRAMRELLDHLPGAHSSSSAQVFA